MSNIYAERYRDLYGIEHNISFQARIGDNVTIGRGVIIEKNCVIEDDVFIGNYVVLRENTHVKHGAKLSHFVTTEPGARIGRYVNMGIYSHVTKDAILEDMVFYGYNSVTLNAKNISYKRPEMKQVLEPPRVCYGARIGGRVTIMPGVVIGREAFIGAVSLVTKDVPEFEIWCGHPAKKVGVVPQKERL